MSDAWVINASPLILFARIARLDLFERLSPRIIVPGAVIEEVRAGQDKDPTVATALSWAVERAAHQMSLFLLVSSIGIWVPGSHR